jgi:hypothetical protein
MEQGITTIGSLVNGVLYHGNSASRAGHQGKLVWSCLTCGPEKSTGSPKKGRGSTIAA